MDAERQAAADRYRSRTSGCGSAGIVVVATLHDGRAGRCLRLAKALTAAGATSAGLLARRNRLGAIAAGAALLTGSALTRFGIFEAGMTSARDPKYTVEPQRARRERFAPSRVE